MIKNNLPTVICYLVVIFYLLVFSNILWYKFSDYILYIYFFVIFRVAFAINVGSTHSWDKLLELLEKDHNELSGFQ